MRSIIYDIYICTNCLWKNLLFLVQLQIKHGNNNINDLNDRNTITITKYPN